MRYRIQNTFFFFPILVLGILCVFSKNQVWASNTSVVNATVQLSVCGNSLKEDGEQCDQADLAGATCASLGYSSGTLSCSVACEFDVSNCSTAASATANTTFLPTSDLTYILPDNNYTFSIFMPHGIYEQTLSLFAFSHDSADLSSAEPAPVGKNFVGKLYDIVFANENGEIVHTLERSSLITLSYAGADLNLVDENSLAPYRHEEGSPDWSIVPNYNQNKNNKTFTFSTDQFSQFTIFGIPLSNNPGGNSFGGGNYKATPEERKKIIAIADFNHDNKVDVVDLSILLYYYNQTGSQVARYDLNGDGKVDIIDVSIMLYYWNITS